MLVVSVMYAAKASLSAVAGILGGGGLLFPAGNLLSLCFFILSTKASRVPGSLIGKLDGVNVIPTSSESSSYSGALLALGAMRILLLFIL